MRIFISAGEASGDALGAALIEGLRSRVTFDAFGMGGPRMSALGFRAEKSANEVGVVGFVEVVRHLPRLFRLVDELALSAIDQKAELAVLIDVPDFNIRLAKKLKRAGIPVVFYVGPSVWAWRPKRVYAYKPWIDRLLVLFPFELPVWRAAGVDTVCVGHPLADEIPQASSETSVEPRTVALLPGSRRGEIDRHLATLLEAGKELLRRGLVERFVLPVAPTLDRELLDRHIRHAELTDRVELVSGIAGDPEPRRRALARSSLALVASGTATLETALMGRPQIIVYRVHWLSYWIARFATKLRLFGLPNIIAGREVSPELIQDQFTARAVVENAERLLSDGTVRESMRDDYRDVRARLGDPGAGARAADAVLEVYARTSGRA